MPASKRRRRRRWTAGDLKIRKLLPRSTERDVESPDECRHLKGAFGAVRSWHADDSREAGPGELVWKGGGAAGGRHGDCGRSQRSTVIESSAAEAVLHDNAGRVVTRRRATRFTAKDLVRKASDGFVAPPAQQPPTTYDYVRP